MLVDYKQKIIEQKQLRKKFQNLRKNFRVKKFLAERKFSAEEFLFVKYLRTFEKTKNLRNEDLEILFVTKTIVCQFHETGTFVFFQRP